MDILKVLELNPRTASVSNALWTGVGYRQRNTGSDSIIVSPPFYPRLAEFLGFQILPAESGLLVALAVPDEFGLNANYENEHYTDKLDQALSPPNDTLPVGELLHSGQLPYKVERKWKSWNGTHWVSSLNASYQTPDELRLRIKKWIGPIQFYLKIVNNSSSSFVLASEIRLGLRVSRDVIEYVLSYGLPTRFAVPVRLWRNVMPDETGRKVALPLYFEANRVSNAQLLQIHGITKAVAKADHVELEEQVRLEPGVLSFDYTPLVERTGEIYQVSELPCILLSPMEETNAWRLAGTSSLMTDVGQLFWQGSYQFDQIVSVIILAREQEDIAAISDSLLNLITNSQTAYVECQPWGDVVVLNFVSGLENKSQIQTIPGIRTKSFKISLNKVVRGGRFVTP